MRELYTTRTREDPWTATTTPHEFYVDGVPQDRGGWTKADYRICKDTSHPDFYKRMKAGEIISSDFMTSKTTCLAAPAHHRIRQTELSSGSIVSDAQGYWSLGYYFPNQNSYDNYAWLESNLNDPLNLEEELLINQTLLRAYGKVNESPSQALVTLYELPKTVRQMKSLYRRVLHYFTKVENLRKRERRLRHLKRLRRGNKKAIAFEIASLSRKIASDWLEVRYGLRPLYYDIRSTLEAFIGPRNTRTRFTATAGTTSDNEETITHSGGNIDLKREMNETLEVRAGVLVEYTLKNLQSLERQLGLNRHLSNVWEVIPYTWIADWFVNTADYFSAWSSQAGVQVLGDWVVVDHFLNNRNYISRFEVPDTPTYSYEVSNFIAGSQTRDFTHTRRYVNVGKPFFFTPNIRLSGAKLTDLAALVRTSASRSRYLRV